MEHHLILTCVWQLFLSQTLALAFPRAPRSARLRKSTYLIDQARREILHRAGQAQLEFQATQSSCRCCAPSGQTGWAKYSKTITPLLFSASIWIITSLHQTTENSSSGGLHCVYFPTGTF